MRESETRWTNVYPWNGYGSLYLGPHGHLYLFTDDLYISEDDGASWSGMNIAPCPVDSIAFYGDDVYFAGWHGVYKLQNGACTKTCDELEGGYIKRLVATEDGNLLAAMGGHHGTGELRGIYRSTDQGKSWTQVVREEIMTSLAVGPDGTVFAGTRNRQIGENEWVQARIYQSFDQGETWEFQDFPQFYYVSDFAFGKTAGQVFISYGTVFESKDNGSTWTDLRAGGHANSVGVDSGGNLFTGNWAIGVRGYSNGTWISQNSGIVGSQIRSVAFDLGGNLLAGSYVGGVYRSPDRGESWQGPWLEWPTVPFTSIAVNSKGYIFLGGWFAYSLDGKEWIQTGFPGNVVVDHLDNLYLYRWNPGEGVWKLTGELSDPSPFTRLGLEGNEITAMAISREGAIFAGTHRGQGGLWRSDDSGRSWRQIAHPDFANDHVLSIAISPNGTIFLSSYDSYAIWRSQDGGNSWERIFDHHAASLAVNDEGQVFAGMFHGGVLFSDDNGDSCVMLGPEQGMTNRFPFSFAFDKEGYAYAGTWGGGVFRTTVPTYTFIPVSIDIKPGTYPNTINLGSHGVVPVAILSSESFDATKVDPVTVTFAGASVRLKGKGTPMASKQDVNNDGRTDFVVNIETEALQLSSTSKEAILEGATSDGRKIRGTDSVKIIP